MSMQSTRMEGTSMMAIVLSRGVSCALGLGKTAMQIEGMGKTQTTGTTVKLIRTESMKIERNG